MEWIIVLLGDESDLKELSKVYTLPDLTIKKIVENDHSYYILTSSHFLPLSPYNSVKEIAQKIVNDLTAGIILQLNSRKAIEIEYISQVDEKGKKAVFLEATISGSGGIYASLQIGRNDGSVETIHAAEPIVRWIKIKQKDKNVAKIFQYINQDFNSWANFYNICEVIEKDGFSHLQRGGKYRQKVENLRQTANCFLAIGPDARHSKETIPPPKNPMTQSEAKDFVKMLIYGWLKTKESNPCD